MFRSFTAHPDRVMHSNSNIQYAQCIVPASFLLNNCIPWKITNSVIRMCNWKHIKLLYSCCRVLANAWLSNLQKRAHEEPRDDSGACGQWLRLLHMLPHKSASVHSQQLWQSICVYRRKGKTHNVPGEGGKHRLMDMVGTTPHPPAPSILTLLCPSDFVPTPHSAPCVYYTSVTRLLHVYYTASSDS